METLFIPIALIVVGVFITVAPLIIWRNTNRTNKLLVLIARQQGVNYNEIIKAMR